MLTMIQNLLSSSSFVPHGHCYLWKPGLVSLHIASDALIALAYYFIPLVLIYIVRKRGDMPFDGIFFLFGCFILVCGTGHLMDIWTLWYPTYWISGALKAFTALISVGTGAVLVSLTPSILALPSPAQLEAANQKLEQEVIDRQQAKLALQQSQQMLQLVIDTFPQRVFWKDAQFRYLGCNKLFALDAGLKSPEDILGREDYELAWREIAPLCRAEDELILKQKQTKVDYEASQVRQDGTRWWFRTTKIPLQNDAGEVIGVFGSYEDITDRKQAEEALQAAKESAEVALQNFSQAQNQLIQAEKMSSLGQLVAGVAHEINNPVSFIYGNLVHVKTYTQDLLNLLNLYQQHYPDPVADVQQCIEEIDLDFLASDLPKVVSSIKLGAERIRQIVLSLRNFSRFDQAEMKYVDIHEGLDSTLLILHHRLETGAAKTAIEVVKEYGNLPRVECYAGQLNQVFMNILVNAIDAIEARNQTHQEVCHIPNQIRIRTELQKSGVVIQISDNGPGMVESVQQRLFNPFFTTKPVGKGTGMGLSISYQIVVETHKGALQCFSRPGEGTEFTIQIPLQQARQQPDNQQPGQKPSSLLSATSSS